jgi:TRAP-type C4-dicarboxylate transport system permease small subunit
MVTLVVFGFLGLTIWGGWPERQVGGAEELVPLGEYLRHRPMVFILCGAALIVFYGLLRQERRAVERVLRAPGDGKEEQP